MPDPQKNLYQRIMSVMSDIEYLQKDKAVSTGGAGSYQALSEEKVTENVRQSLIRHGLVILPIEQEHRLDDLNRGGGKIVSLTTVNTKYKIINTDNPSEFEILASSGTGTDSQDKGVGKAQTYAYKYMLLRTFAIPTGNDTDSVGNHELEQQQRTDAVKALVRTLDAAETKEDFTAAYTAGAEFKNEADVKAAVARATKRFPKKPATEQPA